MAGRYGQNPQLLDAAKDVAVKATPPPTKYSRTGGVYAEWIAACKAGSQPGSNFAGSSGPLTEMVLLGNLAVRAQRTLELDAKGQVTNAAIPPEWIMPEYRKGWSL